MVIHRRLMPVEASDKKPAMASKKYLVVKNHVREIAESETIEREKSQKQSDIRGEPVNKGKKRKKPENHHSSSDDGCVVDSDTDQISKRDLEELKSIYKKCKSVLLKIESTYGHLLDLDENDHNNRNWANCGATENECKCAINTKVVFSDDGLIIHSGESSHTHHICQHKLPTFQRYQPAQNVHIEAENFAKPLPHTIQELEMMLRGPLTTIMRQRVVEEIRFKRQVNLNMIRLDKPNLVDKLKANPDEVIDFKGTNLSSIVGYPTQPV